MAKYGGPPKEGTTKICPECDKEFAPRSGAQVACDSCKLHRANRLQRERNKVGAQKNIVCRKCNKPFVKRSPTQKTCDECLSKRKVGVGTGNWQEVAEDNGSFKHGKYSYSWRYVESLGKENWFCERCKADLRGIVRVKEGHGKWVVHHRNQDRLDQRFENLELLCVTCHNNEHKHWEHNWVSQGRPKPNKG